MPYPVYKLIHFFGIFVLLSTSAVTCMHMIRGGLRSDNPLRRTTGITHGVAAFLILLGGFGMLARLGIVSGGLPLWIYLKLTIWVSLGFALTVAYRSRTMARLVLIVVPLFATAAAAIAYFKPG